MFKWLLIRGGHTNSRIHKCRLKDNLCANPHWLPCLRQGHVLLAAACQPSGPWASVASPVPTSHLLGVLGFCVLLCPAFTLVLRIKTRIFTRVGCSFHPFPSEPSPQPRPFLFYSSGIPSMDPLEFVVPAHIGGCSGCLLGLEYFWIFEYSLWYWKAKNKLSNFLSLS